MKKLILEIPIFGAQREEEKQRRTGKSDDIPSILRAKNTRSSLINSFKFKFQGF